MIILIFLAFLLPFALASAAVIQDSSSSIFSISFGFLPVRAANTSRNAASS